MVRMDDDRWEKNFGKMVRAPQTKRKHPKTPQRITRRNRRERVAEYIAENGDMTPADTAKALNLTVKQANRVMRNLGLRK
jgi:predicted HTH transcriptional regulator